MRPRALDLFCGAGGAAMGLRRAGFDITGIDICPHPKTKAPGHLRKAKRLAKAYPDVFICGDALRPPVELADFDLIWASPPCQRYTRTLNHRPKERARHLDLLGPTRALLNASGRPYIIENVVGAPMRPDVVLTGAMFDLPIVRERWFEVSGFPPPFALQTRHMGKTVSNGGLACVAGHGVNNAWNFRRQANKLFGKPMKWREIPEEFKTLLRERNSAQGWRDAMGIDWMTRDEIREAVPPAYAEFIGRSAIGQICS